MSRRSCCRKADMISRDPKLLSGRSWNIPWQPGIYTYLSVNAVPSRRSVLIAKCNVVGVGTARLACTRVGIEATLIRASSRPILIREASQGVASTEPVVRVDACSICGRTGAVRAHNAIMSVPAQRQSLDPLNTDVVMVRSTHQTEKHVLEYGSAGSISPCGQPLVLLEVVRKVPSVLYTQ